MPNHKIASKDEWLAARKELLVKEKEFARLQDQLSQQRRNCLGKRSTRSTFSMALRAKKP